MPRSPGSSRPSRTTRPGVWTLQDAKTRFSDVIRRAQTEGPQHVTVHGKETAVILSEQAFTRLKGGQTGEALVAAARASPDRDVDLGAQSVRSPVRDVAV